MDAILERAWQLQENLQDFLLEAEGDLAEALEAYVAAQLQSQPQATAQRDLWVLSFALAGQVKGKSPIEEYLAARNLSDPDRQLIRDWQRGFAGLFAVEEVLPNGFEVRNWLTDKHYTVRPGPALPPDQLRRLQPGEIILTYLVPLQEAEWMLYGPYSLMGKLGKPKLAVAIGNFKQHHRQDLYGDAPELLEQAWESVKQYHQEFLDFFGADSVTLPGYQLSQKLADFQAQVSQKRLAAAGIDNSKSLAEAAAEAGIEQAELEAAATEAGLDADTATQILKRKNPSQMVMPKVELPAELKQAEQVTILADPHWGQIFLPTYSQLQAALESDDPEVIQAAEPLIRKSLKEPQMNWFVWHRLARQYPAQLEKALQQVLERPEFRLDQDFDALLIDEFHKSPDPELPEIANVPVHLDTLFQEALAEVSKPKSKTKGKKKSSRGFS